MYAFIYIYVYFIRSVYILSIDYSICLYSPFNTEYQYVVYIYYIVTFLHVHIHIYISVFYDIFCAPLKRTLATHKHAYSIYMNIYLCIQPTEQLCRAKLLTAVKLSHRTHSGEHRMEWIRFILFQV